MQEMVMINILNVDTIQNFILISQIIKKYVLMMNIPVLIYIEVIMEKKKNVFIVIILVLKMVSVQQMI